MTAILVLPIGHGDRAVIEETPMLVDTGDLAPDFALPDHDGHQWRLADHRGRSVILVFHRHLM